MAEITPEYKLTEFLQDFEYQDEYMNTIRFEEESQKILNEAVRKTKMYNKKSSFSIEIEIKPHKQNHISLLAKIAKVCLPEPAIEPAYIFIDQRNKLHKHGDPKQLKIDNVADIKKEKV